MEAECDKQITETGDKFFIDAFRCVAFEVVPGIYNFVKKNERKILEFYFETVCNCMILDELLQKDDGKIDEDIFVSISSIAKLLKNEVGKSIIFGNNRSCIITIKKLYKKNKKNMEKDEIEKKVSEIIASISFCVRKIENFKLISQMSDEEKTLLNDNMKVKTRLQNIRRNCINVKMELDKIYGKKKTYNTISDIAKAFNVRLLVSVQSIKNYLKKN